MRIIDASYEVLDCPDGGEALRKIERIGRICWKSEDKITAASAMPFVRMLIGRGHESVLEHVGATVLFVCDRGISHELCRHRIASFTQSSTRYCNYVQRRFGNEITAIKPCFWGEDTLGFEQWKVAMRDAEEAYMDMMSTNASPQEARSVLPNSLATEIAVTANLREWRHILKLRTSKAAHPQMRELMVPLLAEFQRRIPVVFDDISEAA